MTCPEPLWVLHGGQVVALVAVLLGVGWTIGYWMGLYDASRE